MRVTPELISLYVDGELGSEEAEAVRRAVATDPALAAQHEDLLALSELFGHVEPDEEISKDLRERVYAIGNAEALPDFEPVRVPGVRRPAHMRHVRFGSWVAAAAAILMVAAGIRALTHRPEVALHDFARVALDARGDVEDLSRLDSVSLRSGDTVKAGLNERVSFRTADGSMVVLLPGASMELGDPRDRELFELHRGTALCTVERSPEPRSVRAGGFFVRFAETASFGVRVNGADVKPAGPSASSRAEVTITVSRGAVEVGENGARRTVKALERVTLREGAPARSGHATTDPMYAALMRIFRPHSREILPGYFSGEPGVAGIPQKKWEKTAAGARVLTLTDEGVEASRASWLVLYARAAEPGPLRLTRVRPRADEPGTAEAVTIETAPVGRTWTVVAIPLAAFGGESAKRETIRIPRGRSRLVRFELRSAVSKTFDLKASLWAPRPPVVLSEANR